MGLTVREFQTFLVLAERPDRVVTRPEIYALVWGGQMTYRDRSVDVFVRKVRRKLRRLRPAGSTSTRTSGSATGSPPSASRRVSAARASATPTMIGWHAWVLALEGAPPSERAAEAPKRSAVPAPSPRVRTRHRYLNRELSTIDFNARVLALAEDHDTPLLERAKFLAIFASNMDEFFQVRVAGPQAAGRGRASGRAPPTASRRGSSCRRSRPRSCRWPSGTRRCSPRT